MAWAEYLRKKETEFIEDLIDFVSIPSISAMDEHFEDVVKAGKWVVERLKRAGIENARVMETETHPVVYADWLHAGEDKPTIMIYGHFDVQPADPYDLWDTPPFEPQIRDGKVFGRGASDDKGNMLAPILAIEAMLQTRGTLPVNIKLFYEGQEEIGSPTLAPFIREHAKLLSADMIFSSDGGQFSEDQPQLIQGLKGLVGCELTVQGPDADKHSGKHGGGIANPIHALSLIIASMKDDEGHITIDGFYDDVIDLSIEDRAAFARVPFDEAAYIAQQGVTDTFGEPEYTTLERLWGRPTLELNGIWGGYQGKGTKTVLPSIAQAKITCRLVADQNPDQIFEHIKAHIERHTPKGVRVDVEKMAASAQPFLSPAGHNASEIAGRVLTEVYGTAPHYVRIGGSIPVMSMLLDTLGVHATVFAFGLDDENIHAPNEFFRLSSFQKSQIAYCKLLEEFGK